MTITKTPFGATPDGRDVTLYTLTNGRGIRMRVMTYGAIVVSLEVPDRTGRAADVVLGFDDLAGYLKGHPYFGAAVGRYANRIGKAVFALDGVTHRLAANNNGNHLHGGIKGFDKVVWAAEEIRGGNSVGLRFRYTSPDGEENYPGRLAVTMTYNLSYDNEFRIDYEATTDKPTVVNLTNHSYFNLAGHAAGDVLGHVLAIDASRYTPVTADLIPTGELVSVDGTPLDFRRPKTIGERLVQVGGYDHNFVLDKQPGTMGRAAHVYEPGTGRVMETFTTEPGVQLYTGNFLDGTLTGKGGAVYRKHTGFCLETQHFPDSPNHPSFPATVLRPGQTFASTTAYRFTVK